MRKRMRTGRGSGRYLDESSEEMVSQRSTLAGLTLSDSFFGDICRLEGFFLFEDSDIWLKKALAFGVFIF